MLTSLSLSGALGSVHTHYAQRSSRGYVLDSVEGLGAPPGNIATTDYAIVPGGRYLSSSVSPRNIILHILFSTDNQEGKSVQQLRRELISSLPIGERLTMNLYEELGSDWLQINGYLETCDVDIFSKTPSATLSIVCPNPYFMGQRNITHGPFGRGGQTINYEGDAPTGFTVAIDFQRSGITSLYVRETPTTGDYREVYVRAVDGNFRTTRDLVVNTRVGSKTAHLRASSTGNYMENVIGDLTSVNGWPILNPGPNHIRVLEVPSGASDDIQWTLSYRNLYGGF